VWFTDTEVVCKALAIDFIEVIFIVIRQNGSQVLGDGFDDSIL